MLILMDIPMANKRDWLVSLLARLHLSLGMAVLMWLVAWAIEADSTRFQGAAVSNWIADKFFLVGLTVDANTWKWLLVIFGGVIAYTKPTPTTAFYLSWPLVMYGGFLAWYGTEAQRLPLPAMALMLWGFLVTLILMLAWPTLIQAVSENVALKKEAGADTSGNTPAA